MSVHPTIPTQIEVDSLAAFVEAAGELQQEPFFGPDEKRVHGHDGKNYYLNLGDRFHLRSALVSFRRIWLNDEASYFYKVLNIIRKYDRHELFYILWAEKIRETHTRTEGTVQIYGGGLSNQQLVDLWLNAVFAHNNIAQKKRDPKRLDRVDFDRYAKSVHPGYFEYAFRLAVWEFGLCYLNLLRCIARPTLANWKEKYGLIPSFEIGMPFGRSVEEVTCDGVKITRKASTEYWNPEKPDQKLARLLSRSEFRQLGSVLKEMKVPHLEAILGQADSYKNVLERCGFQIALVPVPDKTDPQRYLDPLFLASIPCHSTIAPGLPDFDTVIYSDKRLVTQKGALDWFNVKFLKLKVLLAEI